MANVLKMAIIEAIHSLRSAGLSCREIARRLGVHRETVSRHLRQGPEAGATRSRAAHPSGNAWGSAIDRAILSHASTVDRPVCQRASSLSRILSPSAAHEPEAHPMRQFIIRLRERFGAFGGGLHLPRRGAAGPSRKTGWSSTIRRRMREALPMPLTMTADSRTDY